MLPLQARVDLGAMALKEYSAFLKDPAIMACYSQIQSMYSTALADWASVLKMFNLGEILQLIVKVKLATVVEGDQKAPFSKFTTPKCKAGRYSFPQIAPLNPRYVPILLSLKQGGIKYYFKSFWWDSTWDWTQLSQNIGEHSTH